MGLFSSAPPPRPATIPSDEIIPLHFWNTALCMRGTVLDVSLKFDDVLDISKLRAGLDQLLEIQDWRHLGARLRMNVGSLNPTSHSRKYLTRRDMLGRWKAGISSSVPV